jgi:hypothetical protein
VICFGLICYGMKKEAQNQEQMRHSDRSTQNAALKTKGHHIWQPRDLLHSIHPQVTKDYADAVSLPSRMISSLIFSFCFFNPAICNPSVLGDR